MLSISEFKKLYNEIKTISNFDQDENKNDNLKNIFLDFFCNKFKDSSSIFIKFDWCALSRVRKNIFYIFNFVVCTRL